MSNYNELEVAHGGQTFIFVTRGRAKPFTVEEAVDYLSTRAAERAKKPTVGSSLEGFLAEEELEAWSIPDDKHRRHMFYRDLQRGVDFCAQKYGVSEEQIKAEAKRLGERGF